MREAQWKDYELIDCSDGERLERWGDIILIRPDPLLCGAKLTQDISAAQAEEGHGIIIQKFHRAGQ